MEIISQSINETADCARKFLEDLMKQRPLDRATVVGLYGDLGSGKTTFVQFVGQALGLERSIQSPTFVIIKRYPLSSTKRPPHPVFHFLFHLDAFRLDKAEELQKLGFDEILTDPANLVLIEWADRVSEILPADHLKIFFQFIDRQARKIELT